MGRFQAVASFLAWYVGCEGREMYYFKSRCAFLLPLQTGSRDPPLDECNLFLFAVALLYGISNTGRQCPYYVMLYMQSVLIRSYLVLYTTSMQSVLIIPCFICKLSLLLSALYAKVLITYKVSLLFIQCFICKVSLLFRALYAKYPYYLVLFMQSVNII